MIQVVYMKTYAFQLGSFFWVNSNLDSQEECSGFPEYDCFIKKNVNVWQAFNRVFLI